MAISERQRTSRQWTWQSAEKLTTALLDRLAHHATVIATKGKSFRMRKKGLTERTTEDQTTTAALPKSARKA